MIKKVLFFDHNWENISNLVYSFGEISKDLNINILLLSDRKKTKTLQNIQIQNIYDIQQYLSLNQLQQKLSFSLHKRIAVERAFFNYSCFRKNQCYSRLSYEQIEKNITPYVNALDFSIRQNCDLIIDWFPDNFLSSIASKFAEFYHKKFAAFFPHYWWQDGALVVDRPDMTSSIMEKNYKKIYKKGLTKFNEKALTIYKTKKSLFYFNSSQTYHFKDRIKLFLNRQFGYQPFSIIHFISRKVSQKISFGLIKNFIKFKKDLNINEKFVLYPMHISPEASILGTTPELADQFSLIKNISLNLPVNVKLYVKQHPFEHVGLGFDFMFYRRISSLQNVCLIHKSVNIEKLFKHPRFLALSILAGTAALDAALQQKPVFVFGKTYFSFAHCFIKPLNFDHFFEDLQKISRNKFKFNIHSLKALLISIDKSVVRANVDFINQNNMKDLSMQLPKIWYQYIKNINKYA